MGMTIQKVTYSKIKSYEPIYENDVFEGSQDFAEFLLDEFEIAGQNNTAYVCSESEIKNRIEEYAKSKYKEDQTKVDKLKVVLKFGKLNGFECDYFIC